MILIVGKTGGRPWATYALLPIGRSITRAVAQDAESPVQAVVFHGVGDKLEPARMAA